MSHSLHVVLAQARIADFHRAAASARLASSQAVATDPIAGNPKRRYASLLARTR